MRAVVAKWTFLVAIVDAVDDTIVSFVDFETYDGATQIQAYREAHKSLHKRGGYGGRSKVFSDYYDAETRGCLGWCDKPDATPAMWLGQRTLKND